MIWIVGLFLGAIVLGVVQGRRDRKSTLSGLNASRPMFTAEPPPGRLGSRRKETL